MLKIQYLDTEIPISDVAIIWIVVDKEKNAAFTVVMGRLVIRRYHAGKGHEADGIQVGGSGHHRGDIF